METLSKLSNIVISLFALYSLNASTIDYKHRPNIDIKVQNHDYKTGISVLDDLINNFEAYRNLYDNLLEYENKGFKARLDPLKVKLTPILNL